MHLGGGGLVLHNPIIYFGNSYPQKFSSPKRTIQCHFPNHPHVWEQEGDMTFVCSALQERMVCKRSSKNDSSHAPFLRHSLHPATQRFMLCLVPNSFCWRLANLEKRFEFELSTDSNVYKFIGSVDFAFPPHHQCLFSVPTSPR